MKKDQLLDAVDAMIDEEIEITNLQDEEHYNPEALNTIWKIRDLIEQLE